jgi:hypothetical protein
MTDPAPIQAVRVPRKATEDDSLIEVIVPTEPAQLDRESGQLMLSVLLDLRGERES